MEQPSLSADQYMQALEARVRELAIIEVQLRAVIDAQAAQITELTAAAAASQAPVPSPHLEEH